MSDFSYRFCPSCGGPLVRRVVRPGEPERLACPACEFVHYLNPKVAVGTIIAADSGRLVMVRRAIQPGYGLWVFPGGFVDRGEPLEVAAVREAREESGLDVRLDALVYAYSYRDAAPVIIVYAATAVGGELVPDDESLEAALFEPDELPWDALAFDSTRDALRDYLDGRRLPMRGRISNPWPGLQFRPESAGPREQEP